MIGKLVAGLIGAGAMWLATKAAQIYVDATMAQVFDELSRAQAEAYRNLIAGMRSGL